MKRGLGLLFIFILGLSFTLTSAIQVSSENIETLAAQYGIDPSNINVEDIQQLADENGIDINNITSDDIEKSIQENNVDINDITIDDVKAVAEDFGVKPEVIDNVLDGFIDGASCILIETYSSEIIGSEIPKQIPYKNEIINLYVSNEIFGHIVMENKVLTNFSCGENNEETYNIYIKDSSVFLNYVNGFEIEILKEDLKDKDIVVKGVGVWRKLKWFFAKIALKFI